MRRPPWSKEIESKEYTSRTSLFIYCMRLKAITVGPPARQPRARAREREGETDRERIERLQLYIRERERAGERPLAARAAAERVCQFLFSQERCLFYCVLPLPPPLLDRTR